MLENIELDELMVEKSLPKNVKLELNLAIDTGSTETRGVVFTYNDEDSLPVEDVEDSNYAIGDYDEDYSDIEVMSAQVYDSLEVKLRTINEEKFSFLKGTLAKQVETNRNSSSSMSKAEQESTQVNIHAFIVMELLKYIIDTGTDIEGVTVTIKLTLALPPEDTDRGRVEIIKQSLEGVFEAELPRLNKTLSYCILKEDIKIVSECNATSTYYAIMVDDGSMIENEENIIVFEGGGRSSSVSVIKEGKLIKRLNVNDNTVSGTQLRDALASKIAELRKTNQPSPRNAEKALTTCFYNHGSEKINVVEEVDVAKKEFAVKAVTPLITAVGKAGLSMGDIQKIVFSGRLFLPVIEDGEVLSPSLSEYVLDEFNKVGNTTAKGILLEKRYPIPQGLAAYRVGVDASKNKLGKDA